MNRDFVSFVLSSVGAPKMFIVSFHWILDIGYWTSFSFRTATKFTCAGQSEIGPAIKYLLFIILFFFFCIFFSAFCHLSHFSGKSTGSLFVPLNRTTKICLFENDFTILAIRSLTCHLLELVGQHIGDTLQQPSGRLFGTQHHQLHGIVAVQ